MSDAPRATDEITAPPVGEIDIDFIVAVREAMQMRRPIAPNVAFKCLGWAVARIGELERANAKARSILEEAVPDAE